MIGTRAISCECGGSDASDTHGSSRLTITLLFCPLLSVPHFILVFYADSRPVDWGDSRYPARLEDRRRLIYIVKRNVKEVYS